MNGAFHEQAIKKLLINQLWKPKVYKRWKFKRPFLLIFFQKKTNIQCRFDNAKEKMSLK